MIPLVTVIQDIYIFGEENLNLHKARPPRLFLPPLWHKPDVKTSGSCPYPDITRLYSTNWSKIKIFPWYFDDMSMIFHDISMIFHDIHQKFTDQQILRQSEDLFHTLHLATMQSSDHPRICRRGADQPNLEVVSKLQTFVGLRSENCDKHIYTNVHRNRNNYRIYNYYR